MSYDATRTLLLRLALIETEIKPTTVDPELTIGDLEAEKHTKLYMFFVDAKRYETDQASLNGADIKRIASIPPTYQLFPPLQGDQPILDSEGVDMAGKIKHFYGVPPATLVNDSALQAAQGQHRHRLPILASQ